MGKKKLSISGRSNSKRSQTAIELMIIIGFVFFAFTIFMVSIQISTSDKLKEERNLRVKEIAIDVQDEINLAFQSSDGYYREFKIPEDINSIEYEINIVEGLVYIRTDDGKNAMALPVPDVTGDVIKGLNNIKKEDGVVKLNE